MKTPLLLSAALLCLAMDASLAADEAAAKGAAAKDLPAAPAGTSDGKRCPMYEMMGMPHGMMGAGMMGAGPMMGGRMGQMIMMPRLPAGNEKLELEMHAEILQKIGEIEAKYAAQLK